MIQFCIMGGYEGLIRPERKLYFTFMGGADLCRPTVARQILAQRQNAAKGLPKAPWQYFITIMGGVDIQSPTLAEEFIDLREMIQSRALTMADWDQAMADLTSTDVSVGSFTLMGGFSENSLPSEDQEIEGLAVQRHMGNISDRATEVLQYGIGQRNSERRATLRRAVLAEA